MPRKVKANKSAVTASGDIVVLDESEVLSEAAKLDETDRQVKNLYEVFFADVRKYPLLTSEEEKELSRRIQEENDEDAYHRLILSNLRLAIVVARKLKPRVTGNSVLDFSDLMQEAICGLIRAVQLFDYRKGVRFSTYAMYWIQQRVRRVTVQHMPSMTVPGFAGESAFAMSRDIWDYQNGQKSSFTDKKKKRLRDLARVMSKPVPIGDSEEEGSQGMLDLDRHCPDDIDLEEVVQNNLKQKEMTGKISASLNRACEANLLSLSSSEAREILFRRFGVGEYSYSETLKDIGRRLGKSQEYVRIQLDSILEVLRQDEEIGAFREEWDGF